MNKLIERNLTIIIAVAGELNFYGKRLRVKQLEVCDTIIHKLGLKQSDLESSELCDYLLANRPEKPKTQRAAGVDKLAPSTMLGAMEKKLNSLPLVAGSRFIITAAQNNTVVSPVFEQLKQLADDLEAQLVVMPVHYNLNAFSAAVEDDNEFFADEVKPFLLGGESWLGDRDVGRLSDARILPTAKLPVNAARDLNCGELATIVAHPKQQMITLPSLASQAIKEAWTTGCCTVYNYSNTRAGSEAEREHVFGGLVVTVGESAIDVTNVRQGKDGSLQFVAFDGSRLGDWTGELDAVLGDLHCEMQDEIAFDVTLQWLVDCNIRNVALHDIAHFETRSHHNRKSGKHLYKMQKQSATVLDDLIEVISQVNAIAASVTGKVYCVESNHNAAVDIWLDSDYNPKTDPQNAKLYYLLNWMICDAIDHGQDVTALELALRDDADLLGDMPALAENVVFGRMDVAEVWQGVDVTNHGHKGQNGSYGNNRLFSKWGLPMAVGHTHAPAILGDVITVGTVAKLDQGYNRGGASSWNQANALILPNGTTQLVKLSMLEL